MSAYAAGDEQAIRVARQVEDWTRSGLLTDEQRALIMPGLQVELRRTNTFLRLTLFLFGMMIIQSAVGLAGILVGLESAAAAAVVCGIAAGGCAWLAHVLVGRYHLYRFGVEEACAVAAIGLAAVTPALLLSAAAPNNSDEVFLIGLLAAVAASAAVFAHFGYVYAALAALACTMAAPFQIGSDEPVQRLVAIAIAAGAATKAGRRRLRHGYEFPGDTWASIEAAAWAAMYLVTNLQITSGLMSGDAPSWFYWLSFAGIWILPVAGLAIALRNRQRPLLDVSLLMALATLMSNKPYLGAARHAWDPIVFGIALIAVALIVRRWLANGDGGTRRGYTATRILASDEERLGVVAIVSAAHPGVSVAQSDAEPADTIGGGGRSGGAGAGSTF
jgi:hypothetical protein